MKSRIRPGVLHLHPTGLDVQFDAEYQRRRVGSEERGTYSQRNRDLLFEESIGLKLDGDLVDPLLINWQSDLRIGLTQERYKEKIGSWDRTESDTGLLREFDLLMNILPEKPLSFTVQARRDRLRIPRRFLPSLLEERSEAGITGLLRLDNSTTEFGIDWSDIDRSGNREDLDDESLEATRFFFNHRWEIGPGHSLRIAYDHQREESKFGGSPDDFDIRRDQLRIEHELLFGEGHQGIEKDAAGPHRLDTFLRLNDEDGDFARDEFEFTPRLTLRHSDELSTIYRYSYYSSDQDEIDFSRHKVDWQFVYRPTDTLRLTGDVFWLRELTEDDVETHQYGGNLDLSYQRPTKSGEFLANVGLYADQERSVGDAQGGIVRAETHILDATRPAFLAEPDIRRETIVAYNAARTRIYQPGIDYLISPAGRRTAVYRILSGRIVDGENVYFDYSYRVPTGSRINSYRTDLRIEHAFRGGLTPYYAFEIRRQEANGSRGVPAYEDNTERHRLGTRYDQPKWSAWGEIELFDDSVSPYDAAHIGGRTMLFQDATHTTDATANASWFDFKGRYDDRNVTVLDLTVSNRARVNDFLSAMLATGYRWEDDSEDGESNGVDVEGGLRYERGYLQVDLTVEYDLLTVADHDEGVGVWLTVRRDLSHLLPRAEGRQR